MEEFQSSREARCLRGKRNVLSKIIDPKIRLIGIGEHAHGDLVSWRWRHAIVEKLLSAGFRVVILCEQFDMYLTNTSPTSPKRMQDIDGDVELFRRYGNSFYPHMIPRSESTPEHFEITRAFSLLPCEFYGIDVKQLDFDVIIGRACKKVRSSLAASGAEKEWTEGPKDGAQRNRLNAKMIHHFVKNNKKRRNTKFLYFAHNEHVATDCDETRSDPSYKTEGRLIRELYPDTTPYLSLATFAEHTWNTWENSTTPRLLVDRIPSPPLVRKVYSMGESYKSSDFDHVLLSEDGRTIRFSNAANAAGT